MEFIKWFDQLQTDTVYLIFMENLSDYPLVVQGLFSNYVSDSSISMTFQSKDTENYRIQGKINGITLFQSSYQDVAVGLEFSQRQDQWFGCFHLNIENRCPVPSYEDWNYQNLMYSVQTYEGDARPLCKISGDWVLSNGKRVPIFFSFFENGDSISFWMDHGDGVTQVAPRQEEQVGIEIPDMLNIMEVDLTWYILPQSLKDSLADVLFIMDFSAVYSLTSKSKQSFSFTLQLVDKKGNAVVWEPISGFSVTLSSLRFTLFCPMLFFNNTQKHLSMVLSGDITLQGIHFPVSLSYASQGDTFGLVIHGTEGNIDLISIFQNWLGDFPCDHLPFGIDNIILDSFTLFYAMETNKLNAFNVIFSLDTKWEFLGLAVEKISVGIRKEESYSFQINGDFSIASIPFSVMASWNDSGFSILADMSDGSALSLSQMWESVMDLPGLALPEIDLTQVRIEVDQVTDLHTTGKKELDFSISGLIKPGNQEGLVYYREAAFAARKQGRGYVFGLEIQEDFVFSRLPFVGGLIPELDAVSFEKILFLYSNQALQDDSLTDLIDHLTVSEGFSVMLDIKLGKETLRFQGTVGSKKQGTLSARGETGLLNDAEDNQQWTGSIKVGKSIGAFYLDKISVSYRVHSITLGLFASFATGGLKLELDGLSISYDLDKHSVSTRLDGLMVREETSSFSMLGEFMNSDSSTQKYQGNIMVRIGDYGINVLGSYQPKPFPSGFLFGMVQGTFGGPPCFVVDGLAVGVGYGRNIVVPGIEALEDFPLLSVLSGKRSSGSIMEQSDRLFPAVAGTNWVAAGVRGNSFQMADISVLVLLILGSKLQFDLLGNIDVGVPSQSRKKAAQVDLLVKVTIDPDSGLIPIEGVLSRTSYVLSKDCRLSGGFAFYLWYQGEHAGDFVLTVGGYRSGYQKPQHYPDVERLKLTWKLSNNLSAQGSLYCALTPSCIMMGGKLSLVYDWKSVHAWFDAYVDILIGWKPYSYAFAVGVTIGVSVRLLRKHVQLELGCDLFIWGPEFSGKAHVKLWIISFTIHFGAGAQKVETISPEEFRSSFLDQPGQKRVVQTRDENKTADFGGNTILFTDGVICSGGSSQEDVPKVNAENLCVVVKSRIALAGIYWRGNLYAGKTSDRIYLRPCKREAGIFQKVNFTRGDGQAVEEEAELEVITEKYPTALWGRENVAQETIQVYTGLKIRLRRRTDYRQIHCRSEWRSTGLPDVTVSAIPILQEETFDKTSQEYLSHIGDEEVADSRKTLFGDLLARYEGIVFQSVMQADSVFRDMPQIGSIGGDFSG